MNRHSSLLTQIRIWAITEGISYLILVFIAMPLKYGLDEPLAVRIVGMIHGLLFIVVCGLLAYGYFVRKVIDLKLSLQIFIASLIPFGAFWADLQIRKFQENETTNA